MLTWFKTYGRTISKETVTNNNNNNNNKTIYINQIENLKLNFLGTNHFNMNYQMVMVIWKIVKDCLATKNFQD